MILVDSRIGSNDLVQVFRPWGIEAELTTLDYADCAFVGSGPNDTPVQVGIEIKRLNDLLQCITSGRLSGHQLPGLAAQYDHIWLVIEGVYRPSPRDGELEVPRGRGVWDAVRLGARHYMYRDVEHYLTTLEMRGGVHLRHTRDRDETARVVAALYSWWTNKEWDEHRAHLAIDTARDTALLVRPSLVRRVAAELPGIGLEKSGQVSAKFKTVRDLANADEHAWREIPGVGKVLSKRVVAAINGEK